MSQKAKQWLGKKNNVFTIDPKDGGIAGSLIGLGYIKKRIKDTRTGPIWHGEYAITNDGREWVKHQRSKQNE